MIMALSSSGNSSNKIGSGTLAATCKPIQKPSGVTLVKIELLRLRDCDFADFAPIAVQPPTLKEFRNSNIIPLVLLLRHQLYDKGTFLKATVKVAYGHFHIKGWMLNDQTLMFAEELAEQASFSRLFRSSVLIGATLTDNYVSPAIRCTLIALVDLFHTTLRDKLNEATVDWLLAK
jgi:hypothetical protein